MKEIARFTHTANGIKLLKILLDGSVYISSEASDNGWKRFVVSKGEKFCNTLKSIKECKDWYKNN